MVDHEWVELGFIEERDQLLGGPYAGLIASVPDPVLKALLLVDEAMSLQHVHQINELLADVQFIVS